MFRIESSDVFLRSGGKTLISVVKLKKEVSSTVVQRLDWEIVETIGRNMSFDSLEISGQKLQGEELERLALELCETRLWVNKAGCCFIRSEITNESSRVEYRQTDKMFDWDEYMKKKNIYDNSGSSEDEDEDEENEEGLASYVDLSPEDQKSFIELWKCELRSRRFEMQESPQRYEVDLENKLKLIPSDLVADQDEHPRIVKVYVSNGNYNFDINNWSFIRTEDEHTGEYSLFGFYEGSTDTFVSGDDSVRLPHFSGAKCSSNVRFTLVDLLGYGIVYGFCYTRRHR